MFICKATFTRDTKNINKTNNQIQKQILLALYHICVVVRFRFSWIYERNT